MAVNFYLESRTDKKGDAPIRVSISIQGQRFISSTGLKVNPNKWDAPKQQVKKGCTNTDGLTYVVINQKLLRISEHFTTFENVCIAENSRVNKDILRNEYTKHFGRCNTDTESVLSLFDVWALFVSDMGKKNQWTKATHKKLNTLKNHLTEWKKDVSFSDFTESGLISYVDFLRDRLKMRNTTIGKQISFLKWFLRYATAKGYNEEKAFLNFAPKLKVAQKKVVFLDWDELMKVYNYEIPKNGDVVTLHNAQGTEYTKTIHEESALKKTRDIFCFCCFTSLRFSDAINLKRSDINGNTMSITTIKTADTLKIELNKYALSILAKYEKGTSPNGKILPEITNQRMNVYVKELCELCEINQPITETYYKGNKRYDDTQPKFSFIGTHTARRTFICNALILGIPPQIVMKWTGHNDYKSMKPYIDITDKAKADAMELFNRI